MVRTRLASILMVFLACSACATLRRSAGGGSGQPIDLNSASVRRVEKLAGVTPSMARRIVASRPYRAPSELVTRGILTERELERITDDVDVTSAP
jgi:DNA uptake protein ComE-like DNA-binding protein